MNPVRGFPPTIVLLAIGLMAGCSPPPFTSRQPDGGAKPGLDGATSATAVKVGPAVPDEPVLAGIGEAPFRLTDQRGREFDSAALAGKVWMGSVFFANCPGTCFRENQAVAEILAEIRDPRFVAVSLTCDPDNDTPAVLLRYAERFEADPERWKFLTGDLDILRKVGQKTMGLTVELGVHSERGVVFDRQGRLRGAHHLLDPLELAKLKKLIHTVLAEPDAPPPAADKTAAEAPTP